MPNKKKSLKNGTKKKPFVQSIWDFIGIPFRLVLFDQSWLQRFKWTTLEDERLTTIIPYLRGYLLDIGAGPNTLVIRYGKGIGVDIVDWGGNALIVNDTSHLPFSDQSFDTVSIIAALNHIPNRNAVLHEVRRVIKSDGQLVITMINPILGKMGHALWWYSEDKKRGGMTPGEVGGIWTQDLIQMCLKEGFILHFRQRFVYGLNNLYIFKL